MIRSKFDCWGHLPGIFVQIVRNQFEVYVWFVPSNVNDNGTKFTDGDFEGIVVGNLLGRKVGSYLVGHGVGDDLVGMGVGIGVGIGVPT